MKALLFSLIISSCPSLVLSCGEHGADLDVFYKYIDKVTYIKGGAKECDDIILRLKLESDAERMSLEAIIISILSNKGGETKSSPGEDLYTVIRSPIQLHKEGYSCAT